MRDRVAFGIVATLMIAAGVIWFLNTHERVDIDERGSPSGVVKANPNYGFSQFLKRFDIDSKQLSTLNTRSQLPDLDDTLVIGFDAIYLTDDDNERVANWVAAGGHLVLPLPHSTDDSLLAYFNIHYYVDRDEDEDEDEDVEDTAFMEFEQELDLDADSESDSAESVGSEETQDENVDTEAIEETEEEEEEEPQYVYTTQFDGHSLGELSMQYEIYDNLTSERDTLWEMHIERTNDDEVDRRIYALGFQYGLGAVSLLSDYEQWENDHFYKLDNSLISLALISQVRPPGTVWFVQTITRTNLWQLIWQNAAHLLLWLALGIVLFFWWAGQRLGRVLPDPSVKRREFNEHLVASGRFMWQHNQREALLKSTQEALLKRVYQRYPRLYALSEHQADIELQVLLNEHYPTWSHAMKRPQSYTKPQFLEQIKAIQTLWKLL